MPQSELHELSANGRVVILHDWLTGYRGGERVLDAFCEIFPGAPIYTLVHKPGSASPRIEQRTIRTSWLNSIPGATRHYRKFLPLMPDAAQRLKILENAKIVLSSHHCVIKGVKKPKGALHVSYIHSPMRYMYDQYENYFGSNASLSMRFGGRIFRNYLTRWDRATNAEVDVMIANSEFVRTRISNYYGRDALVVHPFVELADFDLMRSSPPVRQDQFVMVTAFAPNKRVDLAIEACNRLGLKLIVIGSGQEASRLRAMAGKTVTFLGALDRDSVVHALASSRALIFPGVEDFGITPLESLAAGTPVIAFRGGGVLETLTEEDTVFFEQPTVASLMDALQRFEGVVLRPDRNRLERFSRKRFLVTMQEIIQARMNIIRG